jgi:hypothetical protein
VSGREPPRRNRHAVVITHHGDGHTETLWFGTMTAQREAAMGYLMGGFQVCMPRRDQANPCHHQESAR